MRSIRNHRPDAGLHHRPCFSPDTRLGEKGRQWRLYRYEHVNTTYERLKSIPDADDTLRPGLSFIALDALAHAMTGNQAAEPLNRERGKRFQRSRNKAA